MESGIIIGFVLSIVAVAILSLSAWRLGGSTPLNFILIIFGGTAGWVVGILLTPGGGEESTTFSQVGTALITFITGYIGAKADQAYQKQIDAGPLSEQFIGKIALSGAAFLLGGLATFIWRQYVSGVT